MPVFLALVNDRVVIWKVLVSAARIRSVGHIEAIQLPHKVVRRV